MFSHVVFNMDEIVTSFQKSTLSRIHDIGYPQWYYKDNYSSHLTGSPDELKIAVMVFDLR